MAEEVYVRKTLKIPERVFNKYGSIKNLTNRLLETQNWPRDENRFMLILEAADLDYLFARFGSFSGVEELLGILGRAHTVRLQGREIWFDDATLNRITHLSFRRSLPGEPKRVEDATEQQIELIRERYINKFIMDAVQRAIVRQ